jgi:hypothetical protein
MIRGSGTRLCESKGRSKHGQRTSLGVWIWRIATPQIEEEAPGGAIQPLNRMH